MQNPREIEEFLTYGDRSITDVLQKDGIDSFFRSENKIVMN